MRQAGTHGSRRIMGGHRRRRGGSTCRGRASPDKLEIEVAGCAFLEQLVSQASVTFARQ